MFKNLLSLILLIAPLQLCSAFLCTGLDYPCPAHPGGVFVLAARGTVGLTEIWRDPFKMAPSYDDLGSDMEHIVQTIMDKAGKDSGSYCRALPYAAAPGLAYAPSVSHGTSLVQSISKDYVQKCGVSSKIVLLGYSQGAQVMMSASTDGGLGGIQEHILGGAFFGSPTFHANYTINGGNATQNGLLSFEVEEEQYASFNRTFGNRVRKFCQAGDEFCASGGFEQENFNIHQALVGTYREEAEEFLAGTMSKRDAEAELGWWRGQKRLGL